MSIQHFLMLAVAFLMCFGATAKDSEQNIESQHAKTQTLERAQLLDFSATLEKQLQTIDQQRKSLPVTRDALLLINHQILEFLERWLIIDKPFLLPERRQRLEKLSQMMRLPNVSNAQKNRSLLEALVIEIDYGSRLMVYSESHQIEDKQRVVEILMLGRAVLIARSLDKQVYWTWDIKQGAWIGLQSEHHSQLKQAYSAASDKLTHLTFELPISLIAMDFKAVAAKANAQTITTKTPLEESLSIAQLELKLESQKQGLSQQQNLFNAEAIDLQSAFSAFNYTANALISDNNPELSNIRSSNSTEFLNRFATQNSTPSSNDFEILYEILVQELQLSAAISQHQLRHSDVGGLLTQQSFYRIGNIGLSDGSNLVSWDPRQAIAFSYANERAIPSPDLDKLGLGFTEFISIALDFSPSETKSNLRELLIQKFQHAGLIGQTILALFCLGVLVGIYRAIYLGVASYQINRQLKQPSKPSNNPLGRVLNAYQRDKTLNVEALELRILEIIIVEQHRLESGLGLIKLFAALAPMLGLLGTVTGMIETFQVITEHGNADPKLMAGGISMALVTTVLGLIAAIGLLFVHSLLNTKAQHLRMIIDKQGLGLVAQRAEMSTLSPVDTLV
ncbi:DUF3450 family protein [Alginatibacterium sediminis]|uniref:DUF3450 family protein n=1 Tax=Alginatibacterium sediminis TaxID=2164068 RepID=UPI0013142737|nr:MotA/TolQ/ExbB proton channel family protein [Alginatibacterium sediminis]